MGRTGKRLVFYREDIERIEKILSTLSASCGARATLPAHEGGRLVARVWPAEPGTSDSVSSHIAEAWGRLREVGRILGGQEPSVFASMGKVQLRLSPLDHEFFLAVVFDEATSLGSVAGHARVASGKLNEFLVEIGSRDSEARILSREFGPDWPGPPAPA